MHGCHCNRRTLDGIGAAGFEVTQVEHGMITHAAPFVRPLILGIAERPAAYCCRALGLARECNVNRTLSFHAGCSVPVTFVVEQPLHGVA